MRCFPSPQQVIHLAGKLQWDGAGRKKKQRVERKREKRKMDQ